MSAWDGVARVREAGVFVFGWRERVIPEFDESSFLLSVAWSKSF